MTITMGDTDTDTDILSALDFEYAPPCEHLKNGESDCDNPAEWKAHFSCCGKMMLLCTKHKEDAINFLKAIGGSGYHAKKLGGCGSPKATLTGWERI